MADISEKRIQRREAIASGEIRLRAETARLVKQGKIEKGDPLQIAKVAAINATKLTPSLMPLCHPIPIENADVQIEWKGSNIRVEARVVANSKTGVEMEALTAVCAALLNIWDVVKAHEKDENGQYPFTVISNIRVLKKLKG